MSVVSFSITTNAGKVADVFEAAVVGVGDYRRVPKIKGPRGEDQGLGFSLWDRIYSDLLETRRSLFLTQGLTEGESWPGYTPQEKRYVAVKGRLLGWRITEHDQLRWQPGVRERLFPSVTQARHRYGIGWRPAERTKLSFQFGSKAPGAENHETGTGTAPKWAWPKSGRYTIPKRPFLTIGARTRGRFEQSATAWAAQWQAEIGLRTAEISETTIATT